MRVKIKKEILEALREVRDSGQVNMFDYNNVIAILTREGKIQAVSWMLSHKLQYMNGIIEGFEEVD